MQKAAIRQEEFDRNLGEFRAELAKKNAAGMVDYLCGDDWSEIPPTSEQSAESVQEGFRERLLALAQAIAEHPDAILFSGSIELLKQLGEKKKILLSDIESLGK